jgi:hypothetical protein
MRRLSLLAVALAAAAGAQTIQTAPRRSKTFATSCDVTITSPTFDRAKTRLLRSTDSLSVTLTGNAKRCPSATVTVFKSENGAGEVSLGTATSDAAGAWSKAITLTDQVSTLVSARMTTGGVTTQAQMTFNADTRLPKVVVTAPVADDHGVLRVVAPQPATGCGGGGNWHVAAGEAGWLADSSCSANAQVVTSVTVTGANGGTFSIVYNGSTLSSSAITSTPQTFTPTLTLTDLTRADLVFSATNATGTTSITYLTRVAASVPANIVGPDGGAPASKVTDPRAAAIDVSYVLPAVPAGVASASVEIAWAPVWMMQEVAGGTTLASTVTSGVSITVATVQVASPAVGNQYRVDAYACAANSVAPAGSVFWCGTDPNPGPGVGDSIAVTVASTSSPDLCSVGNPAVKQKTIWQNDDACQTGAAPPNIYCNSDAGQTITGYTAQYFCRTIDASNWRSRNPQNTVRVPDCILYDPSANPQVWYCPDGTTQNGSTTRTAHLRNLPPLNSYYIWVLAEY